MKILRVHIKGWTASYRFPYLVIEQPTLTVPPLSTIYGIISAATGKFVDGRQTAVGFVAPFKAKATDLKTIYQIGKWGTIEKKNVIRREFLYEPELYVYLTNLDLKKAFENPRYPILLGRSCDLGYIKEIVVMELIERDEVTFQYTLLPFPFNGVATPIASLPVFFTQSIPRKPFLVRGFHIIEAPVTVKRPNLLADPEKGWGVFIHEYSLRQGG